jgi:putrescine transport system permease protein
MNRRALVLALPWAWLGAFLVLPLAIVAVIALSRSADGIPPITLGFHPENFAALADPFYLGAAARSVQVAFVSSVICLLVAYPMALAITRAPARWRDLLLGLAVLPFFSGFLLRIAAWIGLLRDDGWINALLLSLGVPGAPFTLLYTPFAMYVGIAYTYLPFMLLPLYTRLSQRDLALEDAAADLGAPAWAVFWRVTFPLSLPGVQAGFLLVFIPALGEFVIPELLGGPGAQTLGRVLWDEFFANHDWPAAAALALLLLALLAMPAAWWQRRRADAA